MPGQRSLLFVLFASLAVNFLAIGAAVGLLAGGRLGAQSPAPVRQGAALPLVAAGDALSPHAQEAFRRMLREEAPSARADLQAARRTRRQAWRALSADTVDKAAAEAALAQARAGEMATRARLESKVVAFAAGLPQNERAALAARLELTGPGAGLGGRRRPQGPPAP